MLNNVMLNKSNVDLNYNIHTVSSSYFQHKICISTFLKYICIRFIVCSNIPEVDSRFNLNIFDSRETN